MERRTSLLPLEEDLTDTICRRHPTRHQRRRGSIRAHPAQLPRRQRMARPRTLSRHRTARAWGRRTGRPPAQVPRHQAPTVPLLPLLTAPPPRLRTELPLLLRTVRPLLRPTARLPRQLTAHPPLARMAPPRPALRPTRRAPTGAVCRPRPATRPTRRTVRKGPMRWARTDLGPSGRAWLPSLAGGRNGSLGIGRWWVCGCSSSRATFKTTERWIRRVSRSSLVRERS